MEVLITLTAAELAKLLRDNGCKVTPQRLAVYDMLAHTTEHPTAEMIYNKVKEKYPTMSFATVYKSVEIFSKLHIIQVLNTGEDSFRYDANVMEHPHIRCMKCGKVCDVPHLDAKAIEDKVARDTGFTVQGHQFIFTDCAGTVRPRKTEARKECRTRRVRYFFTLLSLFLL